MSQMEVCNAWISPLFSFPTNFYPHIGDVQINYINTLKGKQMFVILLEVDGDNNEIRIGKDVGRVLRRCSNNSVCPITGPPELENEIHDVRHGEKVD